MSPQIKPTESELEILQILWAKKSCTVREVHEALAHSKDVGYTTTLKLMQIMFEKKIVDRDNSNKSHIYTAAINKEITQTQMLSKMVKGLYGGSPTQLIIQALGNYTASKEELNEIEEIITKIRKKQS